MKALVTGSTGFIGSHLCRALLVQGIEVRAFHRSSSLTRSLADLPVEHVTGDMTRPESLKTALEGVDVVFHTAALMNSQAEVGRLYTVIVEGTRALLEAAQETGVKRFIYTSSAAALGKPETVGKDTEPVLLNENHTWNMGPQDWPYGYAKYLAEMEVQKAVFAGLDAVILNPTLVFGAGDYNRQGNSLIVKVARQKLPGVTAGGVNVVHIDDVVEGHLAAMTRGRRGERYILGGKNMTHATLLKLIAEVVGKPEPVLEIPAGLLRAASVPLRLVRQYSNLPFSPELFHMAGLYFYYDTSRSRQVLGLKTARPVMDALREAYAWFQEIGTLPAAEPASPKP